MNNIQKILKLLFLAFLSLFLIACSSSQIHAPVFNNHNLLKKNAANIHVVRQGDTLYSIAWQNDKDYKVLAKRNGIAQPYTIYEGQKLTLETESMKKGEPKKSAVITKNIHKKRAVTKKPDIKQAAIKETSKYSHKTLKLSWQWPIKVMKLENELIKSGVVLVGSVGELVRSSERGKVVYAGNGLKSYGNLLIIMHSNEFLTAYGYNKRLLVKEGSVVRKGQSIAEIGNDNQKRQVLFFEMRQNGKTVSVKKYLPRLKG